MEVKNLILKSNQIVKIRFFFYFLKDVIDEKLDPRQFPAIGGQRNIGTNYSAQR